MAPLEPSRAQSALDITQLLTAWSGGDTAAMEQPAPVLQQELHRVASHHLAEERLQTTVLENEAYLRLIGWSFFGGLSLEETAEVLEISVPTARNDWCLARAWLYRELAQEKR